MKTVACPSCQFVNGDATAESKCAQCGEPLAPALLQQSIDEIRKATERMHQSMPRPSFSSFNGFGTTLLDYRALPDGTFEATRWIIALFLPIYPLSTYVIEPESQEFGYGRETTKFTILGKTTLSPLRVLRTYLLAAIGILPGILGYIYSREINHVVKGFYAVGLMVSMVAWATYIIFYKLKNDSKAYRSRAASPQKTETT